MNSFAHRALQGALAVALAVVLAAPVGAAESTKRKGAPETETNPLIAVGSDPIPFALQTLEGDTVDLDEYLGKKAVLLAFWSFFCGPCREEIPLLDELTKKYADQGFEMLSVNLDGPKLEKAVSKYMTANNFSFRVLWEDVVGVEYKTADAYGVAGTPSLVLIDKKGKVSWTHVGREQVAVIEAAVKKAIGM